MSTKRALGKGFGSLLPDDFDNSVMLDSGERVQKVLIDVIKPDPNQPRRSFDNVAIGELAQSIKRYGILQPLVVTKDNDEYVIIAGERRYHAAKQAGLSHLPVLVRTLKDLEKLEIGLIENMQRVDLSPMEQALSIARLNEQFSISLQDIASRLGKAHTTVVNTVRLLQLPDFGRQALDDNKITEGHARCLLALKGDEDLQKILLDNIVKNGWSVREAESFVQRAKQNNSVKGKKPAPKHQDKNQKYEKTISDKLNAKVSIKTATKGGEVKLKFKTNKEFVQFLDQIS